MSTIEELARIFRERYTPDFIKRLAEEDNPTLRNLPRVEDWGGKHRAVRIGDDTVILNRVTDYENVQFSAMHEAMIAGCDWAIRALGQRIERALTRGLRDGVDPISRWEGRPVTLYSLGPVPQVLEVEGICIWRLAPNAYGARFGYYANTGPTE